MRDPKEIFGNPSRLPGISTSGDQEEIETKGLRSINSPYDGELVAWVETADLDQAQSGLECAYRLFRDRDRWLSRAERIGILERAARLTLREKESLATITTRESGKPFRHTQDEAQMIIQSLRACVDYLRSEAGEVIPMGNTAGSSRRMAVTQCEPIGVVVVASEEGYPFNLIFEQVAAAVAAGCPVIVNPASDTPLSTLMFADILQRAGLPSGRCQVLVTEDQEVTESLVTDSRVGLLSFAGSPQLGWKFRSLLAPGSRCVLDLGGVAPNILMPDANWDHALKRIAQGGFCYAGQKRGSAQRVYVPDAHAREFAAALAMRAADLPVGDPMDAATQIGPLIRPADTRLIDKWINDAVERGAELMTGGSPIADTLYEPTVLFNPPSDAKVSRHEIEGPVVCIYGYSDLDEAIRLANDLPFAHQAAVFTENLDAALRIFRRIDASAVMVNEHTAYRCERMPFSGLRQSGLGVNGIPYSIENMQVSKLLLLHSHEL